MVQFPKNDIRERYTTQTIAGLLIQSYIMKHRQHTISEDMYHRVYRLMNRGTDPRLIAAALDLPLRTILNVISRLRKNQSTEPEVQEKSEREKGKKGSGSFLDVYFLTKTRYTVMQLVGYCTKEQEPVLETELQKAQTSSWKTIAIRMTDVTAMDDLTAKRLLEFCVSIKARERFIAILDPSPPIEEVILLAGFEGKVSIFGTEHAFEEEAFSRRASSNHDHLRPSL
jgi:anti-anti-sigma regulatory factor